MPALLIRSIPEVLHGRLQQDTAANKHSISDEAIYLLGTALGLETKIINTLAKP